MPCYYGSVFLAETLLRPVDGVPPLLGPFMVFMIKYLLGKGKAVPLQAWSGPEGSRKLRFPD
jgi:hypothetical protein